MKSGLAIAVALLAPRVGPEACGKYLQAIDGATCGPTNVVQIN